MEDKRERRNFVTEVRLDEKEDSRSVEGYALLFDTPYQVGSEEYGFTETIERGALDGVIEKSNVFALLNHDEYRGILARCKNGNGTLSLEIDDKGLKYRFDSPNTALGDELIEHLKLGNIAESSFAFDTEDDVWEKKNDKWFRNIKKFDFIYDVSPVYDGANSKTTVYTRGRDEAEKVLKERESNTETKKSYKAKIQLLKLKIN